METTSKNQQTPETEAAVLRVHGINPDGHALFWPIDNARQFGSYEYFSDAVAAGFYGVDDREYIAFKKI